MESKRGIRTAVFAFRTSSLVSPVSRAVCTLDGVRCRRTTRRVSIAGGHGGRIGPFFSQKLRLPILERKEEFVFRRLGFGGGWGYQTTYRFLSKLGPFESDRPERIVAAG